MTLAAEALVANACQRTGLHDFGDSLGNGELAGWLEGLQVLTASATREAAFNPFGRDIFQSWVLRRLENRLHVIDYVKRHPAIREQRIVRPIVVAGMLRTGTTILCELLAQDPANRPLMKWEALDCIPPPMTASFRSDPRIAAMVEEMETIYSYVPAMRAVHYEPGDGPTECVALLGQSFRSQDWTGIFHVPSYVDWYHGCDMRPAYHYHRLALQLLQSRAPGRWSLKAPGHLLALDALFAVYPDARLVVTHRDPLRTVPSSISLSLTPRPELLCSAEVRSYFPRFWLDVLELMVQRLMSFRERRPDVPVYDLQYRDFVRDPIAAMRGLYAQWGESLSPEAEGAMRRHLQGNPQGRHGAHSYSLNDFGITSEEVRDRFSAYCQRFSVPSES